MRLTNTEKAYKIVKNYNGENNLIKYYKILYDKGILDINDFAIEYILSNYNYKPIIVNKTVKITSTFGEKLQEKYFLEFIPLKIKILKIIGEIGNSYHCYAQFRQSVKPQLMYINKNNILNPLFDDLNNNPINIDFDYFNKKTEKFGRKLKEHQIIGAQFLANKRKAIIADEPGIGKTTTMLVAAIGSGYKKILIICPASIKTTWKREIMYYADESEINVINGSKITDFKNFNIINYEIIQNFYEVPMEPEYETRELIDSDGKKSKYYVPVLIKNKKTGEYEQKYKKSIKKDNIKESLEKSPLFLANFDCVIIDEVHRLSKNKTRQYNHISDFLKKTKPKAIYLATGTPLTNRPINLYWILRLIDSDVSKDYKYYVKRYCGGKEHTKRDGSKWMNTDGATNLEELREKLKTVYIRRLASETGEMVGKKIIKRYYDLNDEQKIKYKKLWDEYLNAQNSEFENNEEYRELIEGGLVRKYLSNQMVEHTIELANNFISEGEKVVIITTYNDELEAIKDYYKDICVTYKGGMTSKEKDNAQDEFNQNPKIKVFIGQVIAAGVGISLQASHILIFNSYSWNASDNKQCMDRIYRLTQKIDVEIYYQLFTDSISEDMFEKVLYKEFIANELIKSENEKKES